MDSFILYALLTVSNGLFSFVNGERNRKAQKDINSENNEERIENIDYQNWVKYSYERFGFNFKPGGFLNATIPNVDKPIILFDTELKHHIAKQKDFFPINPLIGLRDSFSYMNAHSLNGLCEVLDFNAGF